MAGMNENHDRASSGMIHLVTGGTGLVGNNVIRTLLGQGRKVRALVREHCDPRPLADLDVELTQGDLTQADRMQRACQDVGAVVHAAGYLHIGWTGLEKARAINVEGTRHVAEAARQSGAKMVHVSSVDALGIGSADQPADEDSPRVGKVECPYVISKREAEQVVLAEVEKGLDASIVNPAYMFGPWDWKPSSGRMLLEVAQRFTPIAPIGGCSVCDVRDVAKGIVAALDRGKKGRHYILAGENMSFFDLWKMLAQVAGSSGPWMRAGPAMRIVGGSCGDLWTRFSKTEADVNSAAVAMSSLFHYYNSSRAEKELGYCRSSPLQAVQDAWQWFCDNGYT